MGEAAGSEVNNYDLRCLRQLQQDVLGLQIRVDHMQLAQKPQRFQQLASKAPYHKQIHALQLNIVVMKSISTQGFVFEKALLQNQHYRMHIHHALVSSICESTFRNEAGKVVDLEVVAFDVFVERDIVQGKGDAEMAAKLKRFVYVDGIGIAGLLQRLPSRAFPVIPLL